MREDDIRREIKDINIRLEYLKQFAPTDSNPNGNGTVADIKADLNYKKRHLQSKFKEIELERERERAEFNARRIIFNRDNNGIYPSDAGQDWRWWIEDETMFVIIDGIVYSEPIVYPQ